MNILIVVIAIPLTVFAGYQAVKFISSADEEAVPSDVAISNITTNSATITWTTGIGSSGQVVVIKDGEESQPFIDFRGVSSRKTHFVELIDLEPDSDYSFRIKSDGKEYTGEGGNDFTFSTFGISDDTPVPNPLYGSVEGVSNNDVLVFLFVTSPKESLPLSTVPTSTGNWIIDLSALRDPSGSLVSVSEDTELKIVVIGPDSKGDSYAGKYSDTVDDEGQLKDTITLSLKDNPNLIAQLPDDAVIDDVTSVRDPDDDDDPPPDDDDDPPPDDDDDPPPDDDDDPPPDDDDDPPPDDDDDPPPDDDDDEDEFDPNTRRFLAKTDIAWENMVLGTSVTTVKPDVVTGADSIIIANISDTAFSIAWLSEEAEQGFIEYGTSEADLSEDARDARDGVLEKGDYYAHLVQVTDLDPETEYFYEIHSGDGVMNDSGSPFSITTFATLDSPPPLENISGSVMGMKSYEDVVVVIRILDKDSEGSSGNSNYIAEVTDSSGNWIANIGDVRNSTGAEYYEYTDADELEVQLLVYGNSEVDTYSMDGIGNADIESTVEVPQQAAAGDKISLLSNYGVSRSFIDNLKKGTSTPNTAVSSPWLLTALFGLATFGLFSLLRNFHLSDLFEEN